MQEWDNDHHQVCGLLMRRAEDGIAQNLDNKLAGVGTQKFILVKFNEYNLYKSKLKTAKAY